STAFVLVRAAEGEIARHRRDAVRATTGYIAQEQKEVDQHFRSARPARQNDAVVARDMLLTETHERLAACTRSKFGPRHVDRSFEFEIGRLKRPLDLVRKRLEARQRHERQSTMLVERPPVY